MSPHNTSSFFELAEKTLTPVTLSAEAWINTPEVKPDPTTQVLNEVSGSIDKPKKRRGSNTSGLTPWKKGISGNPRGLPEGYVQLTPILQKKLKREHAEKIVESIISGSMAGDNSKQERLLKMTKDIGYNNTNVTVNNNTFAISADVIEAAKQFLKNRDENNAGIIDIKEIKQIEDTNE